MVANSYYRRDYVGEIADIESKLESVSLDIFELQKDIDSVNAMKLPDINRKYALRAFERKMKALIEESNKLESEILTIEDEKTKDLEKEENDRAKYNEEAKENAAKYELQKEERIVERKNAIKDFLMNHTNLYIELSKKFNGDVDKICDEVYKSYKDDINQIILDERNKKREEEKQKSKEEEKQRISNEIMNMFEDKKSNESEVTEEPKKAETTEPVEEPKKVNGNDNSYKLSQEDLQQALDIKKIQNEKGFSYEEAVDEYWKNRKEAEPVVEEVSSPLVFKDPVDKEFEEANSMIEDKPMQLTGPVLEEQKQPNVTEESKSDNKEPVSESSEVKEETDPFLDNLFKSNVDNTSSSSNESISYETNDSELINNSTITEVDADTGERKEVSTSNIDNNPNDVVSELGNDTDIVKDATGINTISDTTGVKKNNKWDMSLAVTKIAKNIMMRFKKITSIRQANAEIIEKNVSPELLNDVGEKTEMYR